MKPARFSLKQATRGVGLSALLLSCAGCSDQAPSADVLIDVSTGTSPVFSWTPALEIASLTVARAGSDVIVWTTFSLGQANALAPPVSYGIAPPGAAQTANRLEFLVAGTTYEVTLFRVDDPGGTPRPVGSATFVP